MAYDPEKLFDLADALLTASAAALIEGRTGIAPPSRQYVSHGEPAADCAQLTVHLDPLETRPFQRTGQGAPKVCQVNTVVRFNITLYRCVPHGDPITAAQLHASGKQLLIDGWALQDWLYQKWRDDDLLPGGQCAAIAFGIMKPLTPAGGLAGWQLSVLYQL